ncbi:hypothetical protein HZS_842 [Henneguya salminicola]|nr:hypothetical protein HZS_842 [Henneguya salminicola]
MKNIKKNPLKFTQEIKGPSTEAVLTVEILPHNSTIAGRPFLQRLWAGNIDGEFPRFLMWSSDEGFAIFRMGSELFIDATPHSSVKCLVVMSFDPSTNLFVSCVLASMSRRNEYLYWELLHAIIVQSKYVWPPKSVVVYFEKALLN